MGKLLSFTSTRTSGWTLKWGGGVSGLDGNAPVCSFKIFKIEYRICCRLNWIICCWAQNRFQDAPKDTGTEKQKKEEEKNQHSLWEYKSQKLTRHFPAWIRRHRVLVRQNAGQNCVSPYINSQGSVHRILSICRYFCWKLKINRNYCQKVVRAHMYVHTTFWHSFRSLSLPHIKELAVISC